MKQTNLNLFIIRLSVRVRVSWLLRWVRCSVRFVYFAFTLSTFKDEIYPVLFRVHVHKSLRGKFMCVMMINNIKLQIFAV